MLSPSSVVLVRLNNRQIYRQDTLDVASATRCVLVICEKRRDHMRCEIEQFLFVRIGAVCSECNKR